MRNTLYRAAWVLPVTSPPLRDGVVWVDDGGRIAAVAPWASLETPDDARVVDLGEAVLLPGLVNVHAHPELTMLRGALEGLPFHDWILRLVGIKRGVLSDEDHGTAARWTMIESLRAGVTTLAATETSGAAAAALGAAGMRGVVYQEAFGPDPEQADDSMRALRQAVDALRVHESDRVRIGVSPHAPYTVSDRLYRAAVDYARAERLPMALHIAESAAERALVTRGEGPFAMGLRARGIDISARARSPIELLDRLGVLAARPLLIHCVDLDADDIGRIADTGCAVAHCPAANAKLGHGVAPLRPLLEAGVAVGLGTDSVASNNRLDLLGEARLAALLHAAALRDASVLPAADLLRFCTLDGARVLGMDDRIGSLEAGKAADLCAVSIAAPHTVPAYDPVATLFHSAHAADVELTVVAGRVLYRRGEVEPDGAERCGQQMREIAGRVARALA
jgi:cytosine/adenosine deaminase-related metal-dependent hydrolase